MRSDKIIQNTRNMIVEDASEKPLNPLNQQKSQLMNNLEIKLNTQNLYQAFQRSSRHWAQRTFWSLSLLFLLLTMSACPKNGGDGDGVSAHNKAGWNNFTDGNYADALSEFDLALDIDFYDVEANVGKGWSLIMLDNTAITSASSYLQKGEDDENWIVVARAGLAFTSYLSKSWTNCLAYIDYVLTQDATFAFAKENSIDYRDLLLLKAKVEYLTKNYTACWETLQGITTSYNASATDKSSWVISGVKYPTWQAYLAEILYLLSEEL